MIIEKHHNDQPTNNFPVSQEGESKPLFGISLLSIAVILFNLWLLIFTLTHRVELLSGSGFPLFTSPISLTFFIVLCFVRIIGVIIGVAFWLGKTWSWWLFIFYCFREVIESGKSLIKFTNEGLTFAGIRGASFFVMAICVVIMVILYLFEDRIFAYFNLNKRLKIRYIAYLAIGVVIIVMLQSFL